MAEAPLVALLRRLSGWRRGQSAAEPDDAELLRRFVAGHDQEAFAALVGRYGALVWSRCRAALGQEQDAEDAFQATFLVLARKAGSLDDRTMLAGWLHGVACRTARKAKTALARRRARERRYQGQPPEEPSSAAALRELQEILHQEVERLPEKYRAPFILCCLEGKSRAEAAAELGWKEGTLSARLTHARRELERRLSQRGVALSAALTATAVVRGTASAQVPAELLESSVRAALLLIEGKIAGTIAARVMTLTEGVIQGMFLTKVKIGVCVLVGLGVLVAGAGVVAWPAFSAPKVEAVAMQLPGKPEPGGAPPAATPFPVQPPAQPPAQAPPPGVRTLATAGAPGLVAFSPDDKTLAVGIWRPEDARVIVAVELWDVRTSRRLHTLSGAGGPVVFGPGGKLVATSGQTVRLWDVQTGTEKHAFRLEPLSDEETVSCLGFSGDGKQLATLRKGVKQSRYYGEVHLWEVATGQKKLLFSTTDLLLQGTLSADGTLLACGVEDGSLSRPNEKFDRAARNSIKVWDTRTGEVKHVLRGHKDATRALAFAPDGKTLASVSAFEPVRLWDVQTGKLRRTLEGDRDAVPYQLAFSPDGKALAGGFRFGKGAIAVVWDVQSGKKWFLRGEPGQMTSVAFSADGKTLAGTDTIVRLWEMARVLEQEPAKE